MVWLLGFQLADAVVQALDLLLGALADGALCLSIILSLPGELLWGEVGDATRRGLAGGSAPFSLGLLGWGLVRGRLGSSRRALNCSVHDAGEDGRKRVQLVWVSRADCCWAKETELASQTRPPWPGKSGFSRRRCDPADHFAPPQSSPLPFALVS